MASIVEHKTGDGRVARGERTRRALAEALISLARGGRPPAHGPPHRAAGRRLPAARVPPLRRPRVDLPRSGQAPRATPLAPRPTGPVDAPGRRTRRSCRPPAHPGVPGHRTGAALLRSVLRSSPTVAAELRRGREWLRRQLEATFAPELEPRRPADARLLLDALEVATSWETWEQLQRLGRTPSNCRRTMESLTRAVLCLSPTGGKP